jgi:hypothetical protein
MNERRTRRRANRQQRFRRHALAVYPYCQWCRQPLTPDTATADHLVPLSRGGSNDWHNLCLACRPCNLRRDNTLPEVAPSGPRWTEPVAPPPSRDVWVVWTRYPGGRWRATFRGPSADVVLERAQRLVGACGECVVLADGEGPSVE